MEIPSFEAWWYALSTVRESDFLRVIVGVVGTLTPAVCGSDEVEELDTETDLSELYEFFRGGSGGAARMLRGGDDSKWMRGVAWW
jgi:hypothetical protein